MVDKRKEYLGRKNPNFRHGGYCAHLMSLEERQDFQTTFTEYVKQYPRLLEPAVRDILKRAIILEIRIKRLDNYIEDTTVAEASRNNAQKLQESLIKTWMTLLMRCGLLYTPQQYINKEKQGRVLSPEELLELRKTRKKPKKKEKEVEAR